MVSARNVRRSENPVTFLPQFAYQIKSCLTFPPIYLSKFLPQYYLPSNNPVCLLRLPDKVADNHYIPLIPTDGAPAPTAAKAYSICTSFPEGLN